MSRTKGVEWTPQATPIGATDPARVHWMIRAATAQLELVVALLLFGAATGWRFGARVVENTPLLVATIVVLAADLLPGGSPARQLAGYHVTGVRRGGYGPPLGRLLRASLRPLGAASIVLTVGTSGLLTVRSGDRAGRALTRTEVVGVPSGRGVVTLAISGVVLSATSLAVTVPGWGNGDQLDGVMLLVTFTALFSTMLMGMAASERHWLEATGRLGATEDPGEWVDEVERAASMGRRPRHSSAEVVEHPGESPS